VDVVVQGHKPRGGRRLGRVQEALLVTPAMRSREVAQLELVLDDANDLLRTRYRVVDLKRSRKADPRLDDMVTAFEAMYGSR
jgi:hypothetical protein